MLNFIENPRSAQNTWEPAGNILTPQLLDDFNKRLAAKAAVAGAVEGEPAGDVPVPKSSKSKSTSVGVAATPLESSPNPPTKPKKQKSMKAEPASTDEKVGDSTTAAPEKTTTPKLTKAEKATKLIPASVAASSNASTCSNGNNSSTIAIETNNSSSAPAPLDGSSQSPALGNNVSMVNVDGIEFMESGSSSPALPKKRKTKSEKGKCFCYSPNTFLCVYGYNGLCGCVAV